MKHKLIAAFMPLLVLVLVFSTFATNGVSANTGNENLELATLQGDFDLSSSKAVKVMVELQEESIVESKHKGKKQSKQNLKSARDKVKKEVADRTSKSKVEREYDYVFSGFSLEIPANEIPSLLATPGVKAVYPNVEYTTTEVVTEEEFTPAMVDSAPFIGSNEAWDLGFTGEGVKVAIIDTGVDYTHPDLAPNFGEYLGWDFVDNDADPQETPTGDPRGAATTHGSHVAGTVAANGQIKGVAPDATLLAYRVLGPGGSGSTENVVAAIERAVQDGADVMNLSLGNSLNAPDWATSIALDQAMAEGVVAVTSNGNSGPNNWTVGSPGTSREAISVGATQLPYNVYDASIFTSEGVEYPSAKVQGFPSDEALTNLDGEEYEFVYVGLGAPQDFEGKDLEGKIALIIRGAYPFVDKATAAKNAGAVGAIIYNNVVGEMPEVPGMAVPTIMLTNEDGLKLQEELAAGNNTVSFDIEFNQTVGETMAGFSSRGPVVDTWMIKPDVSAPGVNIVSTVPTFDPANPHGYGAKQGTSMASPHVAGAVAVILEANPEWGVYEVKSALMNKAEKLIDPATGEEYAHNSQGAGSIRVVDALQAETLVNPGSYSFGVFDKKKGKQVEKQKFEIQNLSNKAKKYNMEFSFKNEVGKHVKVKTSKNLRVNPGKTQKVNVNVQVDASKLEPGYYEGHLVVTEGNTEIQVPTILFVGEPDYPRLTHFGVTPLGNNEFEFYSYLPGGAEEYQVWVYSSDLSTYIGDALYDANLGKGYNYHNWDGTLVDGTVLEPGSYTVVGYAAKNGESNYVISVDLLTIE
ncbi:S8 family serine peptidase [Bacillus sp. m3-13]|uniref:S8 family serine peptidase n=1 Tax=Bacillus sp. m3-13 TaxID=406124 RepID=UPI0001E89D5E|nr:S8 family serine peptidase [Bacillus sp. m3-13]